MIRFPATPKDNATGQSSLGFEEKSEYMVASANGYGFRFPISNLGETTRSGRKIMSLKDDDKMIAFAPVTHDHLFLATAEGKGLVIAAEHITQLSGSGKGVILMKTKDCLLYTSDAADE